MNSSGSIKVAPGSDGIVATGSLTGCTGIAGFAKKPDGSIKAFVSHYDLVSQTHFFTGMGSPAVTDLYDFKHRTTAQGNAQDPIFVVTYPRSGEASPHHGKREGDADQWHYLDQLDNAAQYMGGGATVVKIPYDGGGHTLASGRFSGQEGIFWNGVKIDPVDFLKKTD
ncbi:MAG: hypothetical protein U0520_00230 [Candidatus Saccharimonadales bacterium]